MPPDPPDDTRFKPGNKGGPGRNAQWLKAGELKHHVGHMIRMTRADLDDVMIDPKSTMLELIVAQIIFKAAEFGDINRFEQLLNRTIGRIKENDININLSTVSDGDLVKLAKQAIKVLEQEKPLILEGHVHVECQEDSAGEVERGASQGNRQADEQAPALTDGPF